MKKRTKIVLGAAAAANTRRRRQSLADAKTAKVPEGRGSFDYSKRYKRLAFGAAVNLILLLAWTSQYFLWEPADDLKRKIFLAFVLLPDLALQLTLCFKMANQPGGWFT